MIQSQEYPEYRSRLYQLINKCHRCRWSEDNFVPFEKEDAMKYSGLDLSTNQVGNGEYKYAEENNCVIYPGSEYDVEMIEFPWYKIEIKELYSFRSKFQKDPTFMTHYLRMQNIVTDTLLRHGKDCRCFYWAERVAQLSTIMINEFVDHLMSHDEHEIAENFLREFSVFNIPSKILLRKADRVVLMNEEWFTTPLDEELVDYFIQFRAFDGYQVCYDCIDDIDYLDIIG